MAEIVATLRTEAGLAPRLRRSAEGVGGEKNFRVNTHDEEAAELAIGVPRIGEPWSGTRPNLLARTIDVEYLFGTDESLTASGGHCNVRVSYETPGLRGRLQVVPIVPGLRMTEIDFETGSETIMFDARLIAAGVVFPMSIAEAVSPFDLELPINNGQGVSREVSALVMRAVSFWTPTQLTGDFLRSLVNIRHTLNREAVTLPRLFGYGDRITLTPGMGLMRPPRVEPAGETLKLIAEILVAPDHFAYSRAEDADGKATGPLIANQRYFGASWPSELFA